jgi:hypothetical protein
MILVHKLACGAMLVLSLSACATRPREFDAVVSPAPADATTYLRDFATCRLFVNSKFRSNTGQKAATLTTGFFTLGLGAPLLAAGIRSSREDNWKGQMAACLDQYGHKVCDWQPLRKSGTTANRPSRKSREQKPDPCAPASGQPA